MPAVRRHQALLAACVITLVGLGAWLAPHVIDGVGSSTDGRAAGAARPGAVQQQPTATGTVVGLGDSVMSGTACDCQSFLTTYAAQLGSLRGRAFTPVNLGVDGSTSADLATSVRNDLPTRGALAGAAVIVVSTGANDLQGPIDAFVASRECDDSCVSSSVEGMRSDLAAALAAVNAAKPTNTPVLVLTYWNVYPAGAAGDAAFGAGFSDLSIRVTNAANRVIADEAHASGATVVDLVTVFGSGDDQDALLLTDGDHPDADGNAVISKALLSATPG